MPAVVNKTDKNEQYFLQGETDDGYYVVPTKGNKTFIPNSEIDKYTIIRGGSKSRKRLSLRRKGKKSYRKKKYGKTKKSRRFRRSVRSRR
jgi:hypothetical protein